MSETKEQRNDRIFEALLQVWDLDKLIALIDAEYQRGRDDYRDDLLRQIDERRTESVKLLTHVSTEPECEVARPKEDAIRKPKTPIRAGCAPRPEGIPTTFSMMQILLNETQ